MLARVQIEHEVGESALQTCAQPPIHSESSTRQLGSALEVQHSQLFAKLPVRPRFEIELRRRAPTSGFHVVVRACPHRHAVAREIRNSCQKLAQLRLLFSSFFLRILSLLAQLFGLVDLWRSILPSLFELGNLLRSTVASGLEGFRRRDG